MTLSSWIAAGVALAFALLAAALWRRLGWGDASAGPERARKLQRSAVPAVGGLAIAGGWVTLVALDVPLVEALPLGWLAASLGLALAAGALDDARPGGLSPLAKLVGQAAAGLLLVLGAGQDAELGDLVGAWSYPLLALAVGACVVAQNALNTFDNADGAATGVAASGLLVAASPLAPAVLVFLVPNLFLRDRSRDSEVACGPWRSRDPLAYLGDGGSQLLGLVLLVVPGAQGALLLPLLDLGRVALERVRAGQRPWVGDRRHLAHRLQRSGLGPVAVAGVLVALALPALLWPGLPGALVTGGGFLLACWRTRAVAAQDAIRTV